MSNAQSWPVAVISVGRASAGAVAWRMAGRLRVTVVVKATFGFSLVGPMPLVDPDELRRHETHHGANPMRSVRASGDLAPWLRRVDVLFVGNACSPAGAPVSHLHTRLALLRGGAPLLDKRLEIIGERKPPASEPKPFSKMPIMYERAFGGIGFAANPMGVGLDGASAPSLGNPARPNHPAGYGPISWAWPLRKRLLGSTTRKVFDQRIAEISADLDEAYFQAAPEDQRIDSLQGNELMMLENLNPSLKLLQNQLPGARALARAIDATGRVQALDLVADTLFIDGEAERVSILWRKSFSVSDEAALDTIRVAAGVEMPGQPIVWPELLAVTAPPRPLMDPTVASKTEAFEPKHSSTMALDEDDIEEVVDEPAARPEPKHGGTLMMEPEPAAAAKMPPIRPAAGRPAEAQAPRAPAPILPAAPPPPAIGWRPLPPATRSENPFAGTMDLPASEHDAAAGAAALPFAGSLTAPRGAIAKRDDADTAPPRSIPGAPWARGDNPIIERPRRDLSGTLFDEPAPAPAPIVAAPIVEAPAPIVEAPAPAPAPPARPPIAADPWRKPDAPPPEPPPVSKREPPKPAVNKSLYKRFGKG